MHHSSIGLGPILNLKWESHSNTSTNVLECHSWWCQGWTILKKVALIYIYICVQSSHKHMSVTVTNLLGSRIPIWSIETLGWLTFLEAISPTCYMATIHVSVQAHMQVVLPSMVPKSNGPTTNKNYFSLICNFLFFSFCFKCPISKNPIWNSYLILLEDH